MIEEIKIYSELWGSANSIIMNRTNADYLIDDNGLDWGEITSRLYTLKNLDTIGSTLNAVETVDPRPISITGWVVGTIPEMETKKNKLKNILAPQTTIRVQIPNDEDILNPYYIDTQLVSSIKFSKEYDANNEAMCQFTFGLQAPYPFFCLDRIYDNTDYQSIVNKGSIPVGVQIMMTIDSDMSSPSVNIYKPGQSAESFALSGSYSEGSRIEVDTRKGTRKVLVNGSRGFKGLASSEWISVPVSDVPLTVSSSARVTLLRFSEAHTALKGM